MRLIDADALIEVVEKSMAENPHKDKMQRGMHTHEHKYFLTLLAGAPTIQPEPQEGEWVYGEDSTADCVDGYRCSQCGFFVPWDYNHKLIDYINDYAYCPNCGAKMKGANHETD